MQIMKQSTSMSAMLLGLTSIAFAVSTAHATPAAFELKIGSVSCGSATLQVLDLEKNLIQLGSFLGNGNCAELGGEGDQGGGGPVDPGPVDPVDPGPVGPGAGTTIPVGGAVSNAWAGQVFPSVRQAKDFINVRDSLGQFNKFNYYMIDTTELAKHHYVGKFSIATTTGSGRAQFASWISRTPGGAPLVERFCETAVAQESAIRWSTDYPKTAAYNCILKPSGGPYYLNTSDRTYSQLVSGSPGTCTGGGSCQYIIDTNSQVQ